MWPLLVVLLEILEGGLVEMPLIQARDLEILVAPQIPLVLAEEVVLALRLHTILNLDLFQAALRLELEISMVALVVEDGLAPLVIQEIQGTQVTRPRLQQLTA
jgi:hypothetical protein